jgi:hypothetical protein
VERFQTASSILHQLSSIWSDCFGTCHRRPRHNSSGWQCRIISNSSFPWPRRKLAIPAPLVAAISDHLRTFTDRSSEALVFSGRGGKELTRDALQGSFERARMTIGRSDLRLHDLRHTGLTLAAATGATTAELMHRAGHSSTPAALRYQHATQSRDRVLAEALGEMIKPGLTAPKETKNED